MNYKQQLDAIMKASGWSQEQLARELGVSFPALNAWLNGRATPRVKAQQQIESLYLSIVGAPEVGDQEVEKAKHAALAYHMTAKALLSNTSALDTLTLYMTYHTNTIEGSTMTMADVENVLFEHKVLANRTAIEQAEARNHQAALHWLLDELAEHGQKFKITEELILGLHLRLMNGIVGDAGQYRKHTVRIMGTHITLANWQKIPVLISRLCTRLNTPSNDLVANLAYTHAQFEKIHPFSDGNGRTGRLLLLAQALNAQQAPPLVLKERKQAYYKYLEKAQAVEDYASLELFLAEAMRFCGELLKKNK